MNVADSIAVFLGPSLPKHQARQILDARYYPPASKGDIYKIIASGVKAIILIDGIFHSRPSVWHRELVQAIEEGIQVFGASSMGALRAVELEPFGMVGCGTVFQWYRDGAIDGDDEVALVHAPEESGFAAMSEPLVNIRYTLLNAVAENYLTAEQASDLIDYAKQLYYPERSYRQLIESPVMKGFPPETATQLQHYLRDRTMDVKRMDAIAVLKLYASLGSERTIEPKQRFSYPSTDLQFERLKTVGFATPNGLVLGKEILQLLKQDLELQAKMRSQLSKRCFLLTWARQNQISFPQEQWHSYLEQWRHKYNIVDEAQWLRSNGLTLATYQEILEEYFLVDWIVAQGPNYFGIAWDERSELALTSNRTWKQLSEHRLILEWSRQNGIVCPAEILQNNSLVTWIIEQEPEYFGINWSFPQALFKEWQITGKAAQILSTRDSEVYGNIA
jgi:hypothetical protein